ncbi:MAG: alpha-amylase family glycosyl hydrolase, partial [Actinomycetota bacterium]
MTTVDGSGRTGTTDDADTDADGGAESDVRADDVGPTAAPVRHPATARPIYFVMPDRFENGDPTNDTGGLDPALGPTVHGFEPSRRGYHHGGDLAGLTDRLPYIADLGMGAVWITPPFRNRFVQGDGTLDGSSSSYHGYWQIDWTQIDPHLGTEEEFVDFIEAAHALDLHVYLDIVINHTGDVITFEPREGESTATAYVGSNAAPYLTADGTPFDPAEFAGQPGFPELDATISFPRAPVFADPADATAKAPDWLNDVTLYHNRGNSTFQGESSEWGDFFGLDDLFTEHPRVVDGMIELYGDIIERYDIDGVRVDTMKHVDVAFWERFTPAILERAAVLGKDDFYVFGEVLNEDPIAQSAYTNVGVPATLDFIVAGGIERFVGSGGEAQLLADAFDDDDWFTDADNDASFQPTFVGNHDEGRMGFLLDRADPAADDATLLARARLVNDLLFLTRGTPVVYYGDEQGFVGEGGDQFARHDMFPSQTPEYLDDDLIGTDATAADSNFDSGHPLYQHIAGLAALRAEHPTLSTGAQIVHESSLDAPSAFSFSRIDRDERREYVVFTNASSTDATVEITALTPDASFRRLVGPSGAITSDADGLLLAKVSALTTLVYVADRPIPMPDEPTTIDVVRPDVGVEIPTNRYRIEAELGDRRYAEVTFAVAIDGADPVIIGTDDAPPYRVYWNNADLQAGAELELIATVD